METVKPNPRVGIAAIIYRKDKKLVFGRRKASHGAGQWALPGGHLEFGEEINECAEREVLEETGLKVKGLKTVALTNAVWQNPDRHYITIFVVCEMLEPTQEPQLLEPDKCEGWVWMDWTEIQDMVAKDSEAVFSPIVKLLEEHSDFKDLEV